MFKKSNKEPQVNIFSGVSSILQGTSLLQYNNDNHWHNQFRKEVFSRIDESAYKVLFNEKMGAPNSPVSLLVGMMILKEAYGWSDSQLFEQCRFNLLIRSALGLCNINDAVPAESTYYLLRKRIYEYQKQNGEDLLGKTFEQITHGQVKDFDVNGCSIRMDSKLIGSNIAYFSRYEIIHQTLCMFYKTLNDFAKYKLSALDRDQLKAISEEEAVKTVYRSTREDIKSRSHALGVLIYKLLNTFADCTTEQYQLLQRVFGEQYKVIEEDQILLRPKEEITSSSVQSPHDPDGAYRHKGDQKVKGYSVNITETVSDENLNLITNVIVDKANLPDTEFVKPAIEATIGVTGHAVNKCHADGAYQSPDNDEFCKDIDMVFTGIQGFESRYDLQMTPEGLLVIDTQTGECTKAVLAKKLKNSKEDRWRITTPKGNYYFGQLAIRTSEMRRTMKARPTEELQKRNNVEASVFQLSYPLRNKKTKYRGLFKQKVWAYCRCLWINFVRVLNFTKQTCQRTTQIMENQAYKSFFYQKFVFWTQFERKIRRCFSIFAYFYFFIIY